MFLAILTRGLCPDSPRSAMEPFGTARQSPSFSGPLIVLADMTTSTLRAGFGNAVFSVLSRSDCVATDIPTTEEGPKVVESLTKAGIERVPFRPGQMDGVFQVV